jgi:hypothetical protein
MKRLCVLILALALAAFMVTPAFATWTRVVTMGDQTMFIQDDYNIWMWPSTVNNYPRHLIIDHSVDASAAGFGFTESTSGGTRLGMIVPFMKKSVLGAFVSDFQTSWGFTPSSADQRIDLFYGYRATNFDLGLHFDYYGAGIEYGGKQNQSAYGLNAGVGFNINGNMLELSALYKSISWKWEETFEETSGPYGVLHEKDAGSDMGFAARYLIAYNSMVTLVPAFAYRSQKVGEKDLRANPPGEGSGGEVTTTGWDLGVACNTVPLQGTEFLSSIGVRSYGVTADTIGVTVFDASDKHFPYISAGSEIQVKNWLQFRFGAEKTWDAFENKSQDPAEPDFKQSTASFTYNVGAGIMVGDLQFDVQVNPNWFNAGPYFLSGENNGDMFGWISIKYDYR